MKPSPRLPLFAAGLALLAASSLALQAQKTAAGPPTLDQERATRGQALLNQNSGGSDCAAPEKAGKS